MRLTVVVAGLMCLLSARETTGQALGPLAQQEAARRRAIIAPARVITAADLTSTARLSLVGAPPSVPVVLESAVISARRVAIAPAAFAVGIVPQNPVLAVSGGEVLLEVSVDSEGRVVDIRVLRDTPPFTQEMIAATRSWQFRPAEDAVAPAPGEEIDLRTRRAIDSKVLVVGLFRPPALFPITLGTPPVSLVTPSEAVPAPIVFPAMPLYPPQALFGGVVLAELRVDEQGSVASARVLRSADGLDAPALEVLTGLRFRPARVHDLAAPAMVYAVAGFRQPVIK